jgi:nucleoside-diphosphate-sugar epimerase
MQIKNITIIGCGWLGCILGEALCKNGYSVHGSARSSAGLSRIINAGISQFYLDLNVTNKLPRQILEKTDLVVLSLPPQKRDLAAYYGELLSAIVQQFSLKTRVIFTSSIGIYPNRNQFFTESYLFTLDEQNTTLYQAEKQLYALLGERLTVLRLGGLIGPERHPIYSMSGKSISNDGSGPINLVHSTDITEAVLLIIKKNLFGKRYNLVFPSVVSKKLYYNTIAKQKGLDPVLFGKERAIHRKIDGQLISKETDFEYAYTPHEYG